VSVDAQGPAAAPTATFTETGRSGFGRVQRTIIENADVVSNEFDLKEADLNATVIDLTNVTRLKTSNFAVNVDAAEGDLTAMSAAQLATRLMPEVQYEFRRRVCISSVRPTPTATSSPMPCWPCC